MKGSITYYPSVEDNPSGITSNEGHGHLTFVTSDTYSPTLLLNPGDQAYLRELAAVALELADAMDAAQTLAAEDFEDGAPCCPDPGCAGRSGWPCDFPGYVEGN